MIKNIKVYRKDDESDSFTMELSNPKNLTDHSGFAIDKITGLGPVEATINTTEMVNDGDLFNSARIGKRNIVLNLIFYGEGGKDIEDVRQASYKLFPSKKVVNLKIQTDNNTLWTHGYVEHNEPDIFTENEGCEISIICPDPKLYSIETQTSELSVGSNTIEYEGDVEVGTLMTIVVDTDIEKLPANGEPAFQVFCTNGDEGESIDIYTPSGGFSAGDTITICSISGKKEVYWTDAELEVQHKGLNIINQDPDWITMKPGINTVLVVDSESAIRSITINNSICYEGV